MDFKNQLLTALQAHGSDDDMLKLLREFQQDAGQSEEVYRALEEIWRELGYDARSDGANTQDSLEFLMERLWFECQCPKH